MKKIIGYITPFKIVVGNQEIPSESILKLKNGAGNYEKINIPESYCSGFKPVYEMNFQVGEWVTVEKTDSESLRGFTFQISSIEPAGYNGNEYKRYCFSKPSSNGVYEHYVRKATIEEINKVDIKVGDLVITTWEKPNHYFPDKGEIFEVSHIEDLYITSTEDKIVDISRVRKCTEEEAKNYKKDTSIPIAMDSDQGIFELWVSKKGIYYKPDNSWLDIKSLSNVASDVYNELKVVDGGKYKTVGKIAYVDLGCKKNIPVGQIRNIIKVYKDLQ